jgi:hypothetical protein
LDEVAVAVAHWIKMDGEFEETREQHWARAARRLCYSWTYPSLRRPPTALPPSVHIGRAAVPSTAQLCPVRFRRG